jgi:hypothetical protein
MEEIVNHMTYIDTAIAVTRTLAIAHTSEADTVHVALELVLHGWERFATDDTGPTRWDLIGTAVLQVAANFHYRDPVVVVVQTDTEDPDRAWLATTRLVSAIADHVDHHFAEHVVPPLRRHHWRDSAATLRTALDGVS